MCLCTSLGYCVTGIKLKWWKLGGIIIFLTLIFVSNGVRQGGILSPYLFSLYIDDLTYNLNTVKSGCYAGNYCLNHIMFADDICPFNPSLVGLQDLLNTCYNCAQSHKMLFNCSKSFGMFFAPKNFNLSSSPKLLIDNSEISFVQSVKYLGLHLKVILLMTLTFKNRLNNSIAQRINWNSNLVSVGWK